jgi:hypothetical protein
MTHPQDTPPAPAKVAPEAIADTMMELATERGTDKTICPSEVARSLAGGHPDHWGPLMIPVRRVAVRLAHEGKVVIYRKGKPVSPDDFKGVYRIGLPRQD